MVSEWFCLSPVAGVGTVQAVDVLEPLRFQCQLRYKFDFSEYFLGFTIVTGNILLLFGGGDYSHPVSLKGPPLAEQIKT